MAAFLMDGHNAPATRAARPNLQRGVFLDRDGVLNVNTGYVHTPEEWVWIEGSVEGLRLLHENGWKLVVVTNQAGIGRGYYSKDDVERLHAWVDAQLRAQDILISAWHYCPHAPWDNCECRKPRPGMLLRAAQEQGIDLGDSWMLGDNLSDVQAGLAAGTRSALLGEDSLPEINGIIRWTNLLHAARRITGQEFCQ